MKYQRRLISLAACVLILALSVPLAARAEEGACLECHAVLAQKPVVHGAMRMGCTICHANIDAGATPHKSRGETAKGLAAQTPRLCNKCHEAKLFKGRFIHAPVAGGACLGCHLAHASDHAGLLTKEPAALCLDCHPEARKGPHVIAGFSRRGHPLGDEKKDVDDPLRPGRKFYCVACHEPHRSELPKLNRFPKGMVSCLKCHKV